MLFNAALSTLRFNTDSQHCLLLFNTVIPGKVNRDHVASKPFYSA